MNNIKDNPEQSIALLEVAEILRGTLISGRGPKVEDGHDHSQEVKKIFFIRGDLYQNLFEYNYVNRQL